jgi:hypothetical protein
MVTKKGKQVMIKKYNNFNVICGTVDNRKPKSLYITISAWGDPLVEGQVNYKKVIKDINKRVRRTLYEHLDSNLFNVNRSIIDFDMRESGLVYGKRSYMCCELTLFQKHDFKIQEKEVQESLNNTLNELLVNVLEENNYFDFHRGKNK